MKRSVTSASAAPHNTARPGWSLLQIVVVAAALTPFLLPAIPVGTDTIKQLAVARILSSYHDPFLRYSEHFAIEWRPTATSLSNVTLAGLLWLFEPVAAVKAYFALFAVGLWSAARFYFRSLGRPAYFALLLLPLLHSFFVFSGFLPFIGTIALYPLLLGVLIGFKPGYAKSAAIAAILVADFGFHVVGVAVGCFTVFVFAVDVRRKAVVWSDLFAIAPAAAFLLYYSATKPPEGATALFHGPLGQLKAYLGYNVFTLSVAAGWLALALLAVLVAVVVADVVRRRVAHPRLLGLSVVLVGIGLVMPYGAGSIFILGSRTFPFAFIAAMGALDWGAARFRWAAAAACLMLAVSTVLNTRVALAVQDSYRVFLSGMSIVRPGARMLPITGDLSRIGIMPGYVGPFSGVEDLYQIYRGGSNPYVFAEPFVKTGGSLLRLKYPPTYTLKYESEPHDYRGAANDYDYILCWVCLDTVRQVIEREAPLIFRNGELSIYAGSRLSTGVLDSADFAPRGQTMPSSTAPGR